MMYKISKYAHAIKKEDRIYVYSNLTGSIISLENSYRVLLEKLLKNDSISFEEMKRIGFTDEEIHILIDNQIIIKVNKDENSELARRIDNLKKIKAHTFIFAFTEQCNFRCTYCFEKHKDRRMNKDLIEKYIGFIKSYMKNKTDEIIKINYYGGEPLLEKDNVIYTHERICKEFWEYKKEFLLITNGYLLDQKFLKQLKAINDSKIIIQITIDGPEKIHNKRRKLIDGCETYDIIMKNLILASKDFQINLRINIDEKSIERIFDFLYELASSDIEKSNVILSPNLITANTSENIEYENLLIKDFKKYNNFLEKFCEKAKDIGLSAATFRPNSYGNFPFSKPQFLYCPAISGKQFVFAPEGEIYTCMERISESQWCVGNIFQDAIFNKHYDVWKQYNFAKYLECDLCEFSCFCAGGCPSSGINRHGYLRPNCTKEKFLSKIDELIF